MRLENKGVALIMGFLVIVVLLVLGSVFILRSVGEKRAADTEKNSIQAFYLAEAGANAAIEQLSILINTDLNGTLNATNPNSLIQNVTKAQTGYINTGCALGLIQTYAPQFTYTSTGNCENDYATYPSGSVALGAGTYNYMIKLEEKKFYDALGNPDPMANPITTGPDMWDFALDYEISSNGTVSSVARTVVLEGDFTIQVRRDNFGRFALFTEHQAFKTGSDIPWFTANASFTGPIHTNEKFSFQGDPAGTFTGKVTQQLNNAQFYNNDSPILRDWDYNNEETQDLIDVPSFGAEGYERGVANIPLAPAVGQQEFTTYAWGSAGGPGQTGIYVPNSGGSCTAGIYIKGDASIEMQVSAGNPRYNITTADGWAKQINIDYAANDGLGSTQVITTQTPPSQPGLGTVEYVGIPDGTYNLGTLVYVDGAITSLKGTVQNQTQITISSQNDIVISDNIQYQQYNAGPPPNAQGYNNLLGILSWGGDVRVGSTAPNNVNIHGVVMAHSGDFHVDGYDSGSPRGTLTLLGGSISQFYGAVGTSDPAGVLLTGYGRSFVYDERMGLGGLIPPYFPSMKAFIAFTDDIIDRITWQESSN